MANGNGEELKKNADTHKMSPEEIKRLGLQGSVRPPRTNPGGILHQQWSMPYSMTDIFLGGLALTGVLWYSTSYIKKKPEASAGDVATVAAGVARPEETHPRK